MILQLATTHRERGLISMKPARDTDWLEEIRSYWAEHKVRQAEEAATILGCVQRAVAEAVLSLDDRALPPETSEPS